MENYTRKDFKNQGNIKWNRSDAMKLSAAIRSFNKKIDKIKTLENENFIPGKLNYQIAKSEIFTRSELNRMIKSLNRFKKENAGDLIKTEGGEILTRWEKNELAFQSRNLRARLTRELNETITERGLSPNQMGDERIDALKSQIESLKNLNKVQGKDFENLKQRIQSQGRSDYEYYRALIYKQNYYEMIDGLKNFKNFEKFKAKLDSIKNPLNFYKFLEENELASDIQYMYDIGGKGVSRLGTEDKFNQILLNLNIIDKI
jgi:hypothetical protein